MMKSFLVAHALVLSVGAAYAQVPVAAAAKIAVSPGQVRTTGSMGSVSIEFASFNPCRPH